MGEGYPADWLVKQQADLSNRSCGPGCLRWFPSFALRMPTAHDFCVISARVQNIRDFPQTKLDSEINARFLLNERGDPHFLVYKSSENNILSNWEKHWQKSMANFFANEINATDRDGGVTSRAKS